MVDRLQNIKEDQSLSKHSVRQLLFDNLVALDELADVLGYSMASIYKWRRQGMPVEKIRGRLYADPAKVALWMKRTTR